jgi:O-antigen ligase
MHRELIMKKVAFNNFYISNIIKTSKSIKDVDIWMFLVTLLYYFLMFFCNSNLTLFGLSLVYFFTLWKISNNIVLAAFLCFLANLPFVKGKSLSFLLLPQDMVQMNVRRDLFYYFPLTLSDFYLGLLLWLGIRNREKKSYTIPFEILTSIGLFFIISLFSILESQNDIVSWLSSLLLFKLLVIFLLPLIISIKKSVIKTGLYVIAAFTIFESVWGLAQFFLHGKLGRYIESFNNMYTYGKVAWENTNLLRISGTFVDPDIFGTIMYMHCMMFSSLWLTSKNLSTYRRNVYGFCAMISGISVYLTGNRILYIAVFISFLWLLAVNKHLKNIIIFCKKPISIFIGVCVGLVIFPYISARLQNILTVFSDVGSATFRIQMIQYSMRLGLQNIFGVGLGMSPYHFASNFIGEYMIFGPDYPHNIFSQIFAETGVIGLVSFMVFIYFSFRSYLLKKIQLSAIHFYLAALAFLVSACFYPIFLPIVELPSFFFLYLGIAIFSRL